MDRQIPVDESVGRQLRDVNVALRAITPFEIPPRLQRIFNQRTTMKLLIFIAFLFPTKMLQFDMAACGMSFLTKVVQS